MALAAVALAWRSISPPWLSALWAWAFGGAACRSASAPREGGDLIDPADFHDAFNHQPMWKQVPLPGAAAVVAMGVCILGAEGWAAFIRGFARGRPEVAWEAALGPVEPVGQPVVAGGVGGGARGLCTGLVSAKAPVQSAWSPSCGCAWTH